MEAGQRNVKRGMFAFILVSAFINFAGIGIVNPILPYITLQYASRADSALVIGLFGTVYSICQFFAVPVLGAMSDRFGRRPILLVSFLGSAVGYLIFGVGGALWVLFLGRIIDGLTGGNIAAIQAYGADVTDDQERTRFYGTLGAVGAAGFIIGPALGALVYRLTNNPTAPVYAAALVTLLNTLWGFFVMSESLRPENRAQIRLAQMNPFTQLSEVLGIRQIRALLAAGFLWSLAYAFLQGNLSYFAEDRLRWTPDQTSLLFFVAGIFMVISQGALVKRLLPWLGEMKLALIGLALMVVCYGLIVLVANIGVGGWMYVSVVIGGLGLGLINPSLSGLLSKAVSAQEQGRIQGGNQAMGALSRVIGPVGAGWTYQSLGASTPYAIGIIALLLAGWAVLGAAPTLIARQTVAEGTD